ncbi:MAG TPA: SLC13 family permease [Opitutaceae bacterium]|nr:SLC13 family permease [Opitutaceae bacterium]
MTLEIAFVLLLLAAALGLFIWEKIPPDVTALCLFLVIVLTGLVTESRAFSVLANPAPLTVAAMFILSAALVKCGAIDLLAGLLDRMSGFSYFTVLLLLMLGVGGISAFVNNTPVVVVFVPVILRLAARMKLPPSQFLIPLSYAAVLGGCCTLVGTSTNLVVAGILRDRGLPPLSMFELSWIGVPLLAVGAVYVAIAGRFLPVRAPITSATAGDEPREYITEAFVQPNSKAIGQTPVQAGLVPARGIRLLEIVRDEVPLPGDLESAKLEPGDRLVLACHPKGVAHTRGLAGIDLMAELKLELEQIAAHEGALAECVVGPNSSLIGRSAREVGFRERYRLMLLAIHRRGRDLRENIEHRALKFGDILLVMGTDHAIDNLRSSDDLLLIDRPALPAKSPPRNLFIVLGCVAGVIAASSLGVLSIELAALVACAVIFVTGCLKPKDGYRAIEWNILILIYGMLAVGLAMQETGASAYLMDGLLSLVERFVPAEHKAIVMLAAFYILASLLTEVLSNNAVAALMVPLALSLAARLGVDSRPFVVAVCIAASAAFATPIGYQTNTYVYGVAGYKFSDFVKFGLPLNIFCFVVALYIIPAVWPF